MKWFRRRAGGKHLGTAVTALPVALPVVAAPLPMPAVVTAPVVAPAVVAAPLEARVAYAPALAPAPRVELGFRDGSTAALAPDSPQARALRAVADLLATRE